jgi:hypothetical protein
MVAYLKMDGSIGIGTNMAAIQQQHSATMTMAAIATFFFMVVTSLCENGIVFDNRGMRFKRVFSQFSQNEQNGKLTALTW